MWNSGAKDQIFYKNFRERPTKKFLPVYGPNFLSIFGEDQKKKKRRCSPVGKVSFSLTLSVCFLLSSPLKPYGAPKIAEPV